MTSGPVNAVDAVSRTRGACHAGTASDAGSAGNDRTGSGRPKQDGHQGPAEVQHLQLALHREPEARVLVRPSSPEDLDEVLEIHHTR